MKVRPKVDALIFDHPGEIGFGSNSGFQALNLAFQFGARKVVLVGFDMTLEKGIHWHGRHPPGLNNPRQASVDRWRRELDAQGPLIDTLGLEVVNASPYSRLTAFRRTKSLEEALR